MKEEVAFLAIAAILFVAAMIFIDPTWRIVWVVAVLFSFVSVAREINGR